jgi:hypothetical protein
LVEVVSLIVHDEIEHRAFWQFGRLIDDEAAIRTVARRPTSPA